MTYIFDNTTTGTQVNDIYADLATALAAEGWIQQGGDFVGTSFTWRIWTNVQNAKPVGTAIGVASTGTGAMRFKAFEEHSSAELVKWFVPAKSYAGTAGVGSPPLLHTQTGTLYPIPWSPASSGMSRAGGDYSIAGFFLHGTDDPVDFGSDPPITENAPYHVDIRSNYLRDYSLPTDDATAVEYAIRVSDMAFTISAKRVFNNDRSYVHVGLLESMIPFDPGQVVMGQLRDFGNTRNWSYDGLPLGRELQASSSEGTFEHFLHPYGGFQGKIQPEATLLVPSDIDPLWYAPRGTRVSVGRTAPRPLGLLHDLVIMPAVQSGGVPPIGWGDTMDINGVAHTLIEPSLTGAGSGPPSLWLAQA